MTETELHQVRGGRPGAPTVVWLHGYTMSSEVWRPLWERLPDLHHVGVDLPSHGGSAPWAGDRTLADVASAVADVCEQEHAQAVVAMSFGSTVALQLLMDRPGVVEHAVLAAATIAERVDDPVAADRMRQLVRGKLLGLTPAGLARMWMSSPPDIFTGLAAHRTAFDEMAAIVTRHRFDELTGGAMRQAFTAVQTDDRLATISAQLTLIQGPEDMPRFVEYARRLERIVPRCRTAFVPATGHLPLQERPDDCLPLLREALVTFPRSTELTS